jgi:hypothetical protein
LKAIPDPLPRRAGGGRAQDGARRIVKQSSKENVYANSKTSFLFNMDGRSGILRVRFARKGREQQRVPAELRGKQCAMPSEGRCGI